MIGEAEIREMEEERAAAEAEARRARIDAPCVPATLAECRGRRQKDAWWAAYANARGG